MADLIVGAVVLVIVGLAIAYLVRARKNGAACIGCPSAGSCASASRSQGGKKDSGCGGGGCTGCRV